MLTAQGILDDVVEYGASGYTRPMYRALQMTLALCGGIGMVLVPVLWGPLNCSTERRIRSLSARNLAQIQKDVRRGRALKANFFIPGSLGRIVNDELAQRTFERLVACEFVV